MDWIAQRNALQEAVKKYRYVLLAALLGILLMALPEEKQEPIQPQPDAESVQNDLEQSLSRLLSQVSGAGKVEVLLSQQEGENVLYQSDEDVSGDSLRRDTVLVTGSDRAETGLVRQVLPPVYRGAVILCQGAEDARVRLSIAQAVKSATGLPMDRITILKMK